MVCSTPVPAKHAMPGKAKGNPSTATKLASCLWLLAHATPAQRARWRHGPNAVRNLCGLMREKFTGGN